MLVVHNIFMILIYVQINRCHRKSKMIFKIYFQAKNKVFVDKLKDKPYKNKVIFIYILNGTIIIM